MFHVRACRCICDNGSYELSIACVLNAAFACRSIRWTVEIEPANAKSRRAKTMTMGNYMGIGVDGQVRDVADDLV